MSIFDPTPWTADGIDQDAEPQCTCGHPRGAHNPFGRCLAYDETVYPTYTFSKGCGCRDYTLAEEAEAEQTEPA